MIIITVYTSQQNNTTASYPDQCKFHIYSVGHGKFVFLEFSEVLLHSFMRIRSVSYTESAEEPWCLIQHKQKLFVFTNFVIE